MYASIRRYEGVTNAEEAARLVREGFVPLISGLDGFVAYYWVDCGNGAMLSTSVFESRAAAEESNRKAADWAKTNLGGLLPNPPQISLGTVVAAAQVEAMPRPERLDAAREAPATQH